MNVKHISRYTSSVIGSWEARSELRCDFTGGETGAGKLSRVLWGYKITT